MGLFIAVPLFIQLLVQRDKRLKWLVGLGGLIAGITLLFTLSDLFALAPHVQKIAPHWQATLERELLLFQLPAWIAQLVRVAILIVMMWWAWQEKKLSFAWWGDMADRYFNFNPLRSRVRWRNVAPFVCPDDKK